MTRTCRRSPSWSSAQSTSTTRSTPATRQRSSPPTPASTTRTWRPGHRSWSTSPASPAESRPATSYVSSRPREAEPAAGSVSLLQPGAFLLALDDLADQLLHVGVARRLDVTGLIGLAVAL